MKALTLWQPWASLVAEGVNSHETRHWPPPRALGGERLAIHAARRAIDLAVVRTLQLPAGWVEELPQGKVVAVVTVVDALEVVGPGFEHGTVLARHADGREEQLVAERFGDYGAGRWIWRLADVVKLDEPVPVRGRQGIWMWDAPEGVR